MTVAVAVGRLVLMRLVLMRLVLMRSWGSATAKELSSVVAEEAMEAGSLEALASPG
jgi:hypothetical protein